MRVRPRRRPTGDDADDGRRGRHLERLVDHVARRLRRDASGSFDWAAPDEELHAFVNDLERPVGTHLYGRRMYEVMRSWETAPADAGQPA
jgi:hypothetical protein